MLEPGRVLFILGLLFLAGLLTDLLGRRTFLPRVTLLILFGVAVGPMGLNHLEELGEKWFPFITNMALVIVGFLLGGKITGPNMREHGRDVVLMSLAITVVTAVIVGAGLWLLGAPPELALILAAAATATDPAATADVVQESRASGPFTRSVLGLVAVDDAWGLIVFSFLLAAADSISGSADFAGTVQVVGYELGGAVLVGGALGVPVAYLTGRIHPGEPTLVEALGAVFVCGGIALWLEVSFLLASMVMGAVVANVARHHNRPFHAVEGVEWPFMILFFVFAGATLQLDMLRAAGVMVVAYCLLRMAGRFAGAWVGGWGTAFTPGQVNRFGVALLPQAGVAMGIALVGSEHFPELEELLMPAVIGATVVFETVGPIATRFAITGVGEAGQDGRDVA